MGSSLSSFSPTPVWKILNNTAITNGSNSTTISGLDFSPYKQVVIKLIATLATDDLVLLRFNGDSGNNYNYVRISTSGSTVSSANAQAQSGYLIGNITTGAFCSAEIQLDQTTSQYPTLRCFMGSGAAASESFMYLTSGSWLSTATITSITITNSNAGRTFSTGSRIEIWGVI